MKTLSNATFLSTLSDDALYLFQVSRKYQRVSELLKVSQRVLELQTKTVVLTLG